MENQMFCYQCQETAGCSGCTRVGVCGKQPDVAAMQDLLVYVTKGISAVTTTLRQEGVEIQPAVNHMITLNLFTTITNANFSKEAIIARIQETLSEKDLLLSKLTNIDALPEAALWNGSVEEFDTKAAAVGVLSTENEDIRSLRELITYGLKGLSAYSKHANVLLQDNEEIDAFMQRALAATLDDSLSADDLITLRKELCADGMDYIRIFAKIESLEGVENLPSLLPFCDEIVIARGDLGNAIPLPKLPAIQKRIAMTCLRAKKPFMVVTQMLASMEQNPVPTRAEVTDIFQAVLDGASSLMLTGETAVGAYPEEAIKILAQTSEEALRFKIAKF